MQKLQIAVDCLSNPIYIGSKVAYAIGTYGGGSALRIGVVYGVDINEKRTLLRIKATATKMWDYEQHDYVTKEVNRSTSNLTKLIVITA